MHAPPFSDGERQPGRDGKAVYELTWPGQGIAPGSWVNYCGQRIVVTEDDFNEAVTMIYGNEMGEIKVAGVESGVCVCGGGGRLTYNGCPTP